ncbi:chalcone-flavanone isomerase protein [Rutstroemia sp. NJR-2017a BVV2]|nr:chalcone-flavanone isomerase protein [Rutstroemia sp. NJR-2017a BVV2]
MSFLPRTTRTIRQIRTPLLPLSPARLPCSKLALSLPSLQRPLTNKHTPSDPSDPSGPSEETLRRISLHRLEAQQQAEKNRRTYYSATGFLLGMVAIYFTATAIDLSPPQQKLDSPPNSPDNPHNSTSLLDIPQPIIVAPPSTSQPQTQEPVPTGTSTVPFFPRHLLFPERAHPPEEYQLLGLGIRTVSFLSIQVYVVGLYIATADISSFQASLIHHIAGDGASTLVAGEKDKLRAELYDPEKGEALWSAVLKESGARTLVRIVPTRNTDFGHLRDAWVRGLTARAQRDRVGYGDEGFAGAVGEFKRVFERGSVPRGRELVLVREGKGGLEVWVEGAGAGGMGMGEGNGMVAENGMVAGNRRRRLGVVGDERVARSIWLGYLAGKTVSSEEARKSVVEGVMEFVERPVGTVAAQVHV